MSTREKFNGKIIVKSSEEFKLITDSIKKVNSTEESDKIRKRIQDYVQNSKFKINDKRK